MSTNKKNKRKLRKKRKKAKKEKKLSSHLRAAERIDGSQDIQPLSCKNAPVTTNKNPFSLGDFKEKMTSWISNLISLISSPFAYIKRKFNSVSYELQLSIITIMVLIIVLPTTWWILEGCSLNEVLRNYHYRGIYQESLNTKYIYGLDEGRELVHVKPGVYGYCWDWELPTEETQYEELQKSLSLHRGSTDAIEIHYLEDNIIALGYTTEEAKRALTKGGPCQFWFFPEMPYRKEITADHLVGLSLLRVQSVEKSEYISGVTMRKKFFIKIK